MKKSFVPQADNFDLEIFFEWSTYGSKTSRNLLWTQVWSVHISFTQYVRRCVWKFLKGPCTPRAQARLPINVLASTK